MAQAYATPGSRVTMIEAEDGLLPREEPLAGEELRQTLTSRGVDVRTGMRAIPVRRDGLDVKSVGRNLRQFIDNLPSPRGDRQEPAQRQAHRSPPRAKGTRLRP